MDPILLTCDAGTLVLQGAAPDRFAALPFTRFDARTQSYRAEARHYRAIVEHLRQTQTAYRYEACNIQPTPWPLRPLFASQICRASSSIWQGSQISGIITHQKRETGSHSHECKSQDLGGPEHPRA